MSSVPPVNGGPAWANPNMQPVQVTTEVVADPGQNSLLEAVSTLDEPVIETIMRDVRAVGSKLRVVLLPLDRTVRNIKVFRSSIFFSKVIFVILLSRGGHSRYPIVLLWIDALWVCRCGATRSRNSRTRGE